jgi:tRNA-dihydrouridine synthase A
MIPESQIIQVYDSLVGQYSLKDDGDPEQLQENIYHILQKDTSYELNVKLYVILQELICNEKDNVVLQLGGRDPVSLGKAAAIATAFGYSHINLNCGCPSSKVASGRQAGAALMREPEFVAKCLEEMSQKIDSIDRGTTLSVKHRLGVENANTYDAVWDHAQSDEQAYQNCRDFSRIVGMAGKVSKLVVHARLALLGFGENEEETSATSPSLWVPDSSKNGSPEIQQQHKIDHKRLQYKAKQKARQLTIQNRSVPPLRPKVVERIAQDFPSLQILSNGGVTSIPEIEDRLRNTEVSGVMVGRSAINHPCSFAAVDSRLWKNPVEKPSKRQVLLNYITYCQEQEARYPVSSKDKLKEFRKKLVAAPFHLFMGEDGNNRYQRRLRKLAGRGDRYTAASMLLAAMNEVPSSTLERCVDDHVPWDDIEKFDFTKRSGALQRTIH